MKSPVFAALSVAVALSNVAGCSLIKINGKSLGNSPTTAPDGSPASGRSGPSGVLGNAEADPEAELAAAAAAEAEQISAMPDDEFARLAISLVMGEHNKVSELKQSDIDTTQWATGEFTPAHVKGMYAFDDRLNTLLIEQHGAKNEEDLRSNVLAVARCERQAIWDQKDPKACKKKNDKGVHLERFGWILGDPIVASIYIDSLATLLPTAEAKQVREAFAATIGDERQYYKYESVDTVSPQVANRRESTGVVITDKPESEWTFGTLTFAEDYVERNDLDRSLSKQFASAKKSAERYRCTKVEVYFIQKHLGGGRYGPRKGGLWVLNGPEVDCAEAEKVKSTGWALSALRKADYDVDKWVAAKVTGDWEVIYSGSYPEKKRVEAVVYYRKKI